MQDENQKNQEENQQQEQSMSMDDLMRMMQMQQEPKPLTDEQKEKYKDLIQEILKIQTPMVELQVKLNLQMKEFFKDKEKTASHEELMELQQVVNHCEEELQNIFQQRMLEELSDKQS